MPKWDVPFQSDSDEVEYQNYTFTKRLENGHLYALTNNPKTWKEAENEAVQLGELGGHLARCARSPTL